MTDTGNWSRRGLLKGGVLAGGLLTAPGLVSGCGGLGLGNTLASIKSAGVVKVGIAGERPYAYQDSGRLAGAIPAVHAAIFERIGNIELQGVVTQFNELIEGLNAGAFDVVSAGIFITQGRCSRAAFSDPVYCAKSALLVQQGNPLGLSDYASVAKKKAVLAVLAGGIEESYARAAGVKDTRLQLVGSQREGLTLVASGQADAFTLTSVSLRALLDKARRQAKSPDPGGLNEDERQAATRVELLEPFVPVVDGERQLGCGGAVFRKTDDSLVQAFNNELNALRGQGRVLELMKRYGFTRAEMPERGVTTEQLCRTGGVTGAELDPAPR